MPSCCFLARAGRPRLLLFAGPHQQQDHGSISSAPSRAGPARALTAAGAGGSGEGTFGAAPLFILSEGRAGGSHPDEHGRTLYQADPTTEQLQLTRQAGSSSSGHRTPAAGGAPSAAGAKEEVSPSSTTAVATSTSRRRGRAMLRGSVRWVKQLFRSVFLPVGWPGSVTPEYARFQMFNVIQDLSTYLRGILATKVITKTSVFSLL